ncbi:ion channel [Aliiruegeria haliotis]|uniref:Ion channel n=1 Tax=Aliiruegeria haliotis TaxID=1280846 RepID=A0A2T0RZ65_9RHOB|nr:potassium channel family protein [Aliiruegeria haliotis]PRY26471.1 ion channel [Aliiruegeria haliotis]
MHRLLLLPIVRWTVLLAMLLAAIILEPLFGESKTIDLLVLALFEFAVVGALLTSLSDTRALSFGGLVTLIWFGLSIHAVRYDGLSGVSATFSLVMLLGSLVVTFLNLMRRKEADLDALIAAIFGYLLIGMTWASLFVQVERMSPGAISYPEGEPLWSSMVYFSLVTLTSLGYGDILPVSGIARVLAALEAVIGVLYLAVMVGSIVGSFERKPRKDPGA